LGLLLNYFQANSGEKLGTEVNLAKAMFVQNGYNITNSFIKAAEDYLNTKLVTVNFKSDGVQAKHIINQYVLIKKTCIMEFSRLYNFRQFIFINTFGFNYNNSV